MKIKNKKKSIKIGNIQDFLWSVRKLNILSRKSIDGETKEERTHPLTKIVPLTIGTTSFLGLTYAEQLLSHFLPSLGQLVINQEFKKVDKFIQKFNYFDPHYFIPTVNTIPSTIAVCVITGFSGFLAYRFWRKMQARFNKIAIGQKGDSRLATQKEIFKQYRIIPDNREEFEGIGGVPITHYKNWYAIDQETVNTCFLGTSRSGKGECYVFPMIDILSRASVQSSMVVNDPKGELFSSSKETLEKRGYEVQVLNLLDPIQGMSYNPLTLIVEAWKAKDKVLAQQLTKSFSHMIFYNPQAGPNAWVYEGAEKMMNGVILALIDECYQRNELEKVTLYNVGQMITELGTKKVLVNKVEKTYLDLYFETLPPGNVAKGQYSSVNMSGDRSKSAIMSAVDNVCSNFKTDDIAMMTSRNSFPLRDVGFPKYLNIKVDDALSNQKIRIIFQRHSVQSKERRNKTTKFKLSKEILYQEVININKEGVGTLNFNCQLEDGDQLVIETMNHDTMMYRLSKTKEDIQNKRLSVTPIEKSTLDNHDINIDIHYTDKPIAVFMVTPDYDTSNNNIAATFVDQLYITLMRQASFTRGKKCHRRVHFILDEFGNMPPLSELGNKLTVCLGRNVLFDLFVQSYSQLDEKYNNHVAKTVKENCQNHILIKTNDESTIKEFVNRIGKRTVESESYDRQSLQNKATRHVSVSEEYVLPPERVGDLLEGESIVLRSLHRQNFGRERIRAYPIFNTKETKMPYRWQTPLAKDFDTSKDINDFYVESEHRYLDLSENAIDFNILVEKVNLYFSKEVSEEKKTEQRKGTNNENINRLKTLNQQVLKDFKNKSNNAEELNVLSKMLNDLLAIVQNNRMNEEQEKINNIFKFLEKEYKQSEEKIQEYHNIINQL